MKNVERTKPEMVEVEFNGQKIECVVDPVSRDLSVVIKSVCDNIGIDSKTQQVKLKNNPVFSYRYMVATASDSKNYKKGVIPLKQYYGWLLTINVNKVKDEATKKLLLDYQGRSNEVLYEFWTNGIAIADDNDKKIIDELNSVIGLKDATISNLQAKVQDDAKVIDITEKNRKVGWHNFYKMKAEVKALQQQISDIKNEANKRLTDLYNSGNMMINLKQQAINYYITELSKYTNNFWRG